MVAVAWSLTLREERRLRVFENSVLRGIFGPKRDEVTGGSGDYYIMRNLTFRRLMSTIVHVPHR